MAAQLMPIIRGSVVSYGRYMAGMAAHQAAHMLGIGGARFCEWFKPGKRSPGLSRTGPRATPMQLLLIRFTQFASSIQGGVMLRALWREVAAMPAHAAPLPVFERLFSQQPPHPDRAWHLLWAQAAVGRIRGKHIHTGRPSKAKERADWARVLAFWPDPAAAARSLVYIDGTLASKDHP